MKMLKIIAAAGFAVTALAGASGASAQDWRGDYRDRDRYEHRWDRDRYEHRWDRRHYGWYHHRRPVCWTEWHHHHPVRVCRR